MNPRLPGVLAVVTLLLAAPAFATASDKVCDIHGGETFTTSAPLYLLKWPTSFELVPGVGDKPTNWFKTIAPGARITFVNILWKLADKQDFYPVTSLAGQDLDDEHVIVRRLTVDRVCFDGAFVKRPPPL